jgi:hypothetical protein
MKVQTRLAALEQRLQPGVLGYKVFAQSTADPDVFYAGSDGDDVDYCRDITPTDYTGQRRYTRAEIDALKQAGWDVLLIVYEDVRLET